MINKSTGHLLKIKCGRFDYFLCKKPFTSSPGNYGNTTTITNQNNGSLLIGLSAAFSILFLIAVFLLVYICYNKRKQNNKSKTGKSQNVASKLEAKNELVCALENNENIYMENHL